MDANEQLEDLVERQAITDVLYRYCELLDGQQLEEMVTEVFAKDGSDHHGETIVQGRDGLLEWFRTATANLAALVHAVSNVQIERNGSSAKMRSVIVSWAWTHDSAPAGAMRPADYALAGFYVDELTKYPEGWRIDKRVVANNGVSVVAYGTVPASQRHAHAAAERLDESPAAETSGAT